jgi:hypothetical protein
MQSFFGDSTINTTWTTEDESVEVDEGWWMGMLGRVPVLERNVETMAALRVLRAVLEVPEMKVGEADNVTCREVVETLEPTRHDAVDVVVEVANALRVREPSHFQHSLARLDMDMEHLEQQVATLRLNHDILCDEYDDAVHLEERCKGLDTGGPDDKGVLLRQIDFMHKKCRQYRDALRPHPHIQVVGQVRPTVLLQEQEVLVEEKERLQRMKEELQAYLALPADLGLAQIELLKRHKQLASRHFWTNGSRNSSAHRGSSCWQPSAQLSTNHSFPFHFFLILMRFTLPLILLATLTLARKDSIYGTAQDPRKAIPLGAPCKRADRDNWCGLDGACRDVSRWWRPARRLCVARYAKAGDVCGRRWQSPLCEKGYLCRRDKWYKIQRRCLKVN